MFPGRLDHFLRVYNEATKYPHGYLLIDAKQSIPEEERFNTNIFKQQEKQNKRYVIKPPNYPLDDAIFYCTDCVYTDSNEDAFEKHKCGESVGIDLEGFEFLCPNCKWTFQNPKDLDADVCLKRGTINAKEIDAPACLKHKTIKANDLEIPSHSTDNHQESKHGWK